MTIIRLQDRIQRALQGGIHIQDRLMVHTAAHHHLRIIEQRDLFLKGSPGKEHTLFRVIQLRIEVIRTIGLYQPAIQFEALVG